MSFAILPRLMLCCLILCCVNSGKFLFAQTEIEDATVAFDLKVSQLLETETFDKLMPDGELPGMFRMMGTVPQRLFGAANFPTDYSFVDADRPPEVMPFDFFARFMLNDEDEAQDMASKFQRRAEEKEINGTTFFVSEPNLLSHQPTAKSIEVGVEKYLTSSGRQFSTPRCKEAFAALPDVPIRIAMDLESQKESVEQLIDLQLKQVDAVPVHIRGVVIGLLETLKNVSQLRIGIGLKSENIVLIEAIAYDDAKATELKEALDSIVFLGKTSATPMLPMIAEQSQQLSDDLKTILETSTVTLEGKTVKLTIPTPANFDATLASSIDLEGVGGSREVRINAAQYEPQPIPTVEDAPALSAEEFSEKFAQACFPGNFWTDRMMVDIDPLDIPNADFYKFEYRIKSVKSKDGTVEMYRPEDNGFNSAREAVAESDTDSTPPPKLSPDDVPPQPLWLTSQNGSNIQLPVSLDGIEVETTKDGKELGQREIEQLKKNSLGEAEIEITASSPKKLTSFELTMEEPKQEKDGVQARLKSIRGSTAEISYRGDGLVAYAVDATGKRLQQEASFGSNGVSEVSFYGEPVKIICIVESGGTEPMTFPVKFDLNGGEQITLPVEPTSDLRVRYSYEPVKSYRPATQAEIDALEVQHKKTNENDWPSLRFFIKVPADLNIQYAWNSGYFGEKLPLKLEYTRAYESPGELFIDFNKGSDAEGMPDIRRAFGTVDFKAAANIETLSFKKQTDGEAIKMTDQQGKEFSVTIDKQLVSLPSSSDVIEEKFFDASGRLLRANYPHSSHGGQKARSCWGFPDRVELTVRGSMIGKKWDYDIKVGDTDETAYLAYKKLSLKIYEIGTKLAEINEIALKSPCNETAAGMRYNYKKGTDQPLDLISEEIAHSDPKGAERFKYEVKPYQGYHFMFADKAWNGGKEIPRFTKKSRTEKRNWSGGEYKGYRRHSGYGMTLIARPADPADPIIFSDGRTIFYKAFDTSKEEAWPSYDQVQTEWTTGPKLPRGSR